MKRKSLIDAALFLVIFAAVQFAVSMAIGVFQQTADTTPAVTIAVSLISSVIVIALFAWRKWTIVSGDYINTRPWFTLFWVVCLAIGAATPLSFAIDQAGLKMPAEYTEIFSSIMSHDLGYIAVGVVAPVAEEMVFRGAILRKLLDAMGNNRSWAAVVATAALFGIVHGNMAQGVNAFVLGLLIGWMYVRTRSIVPGIAFHLTNNTIAYIMYRMMPQSADMTLVEYFHGDMKRVWLSILFSLMIFGAALFQLNMRLSKPKKTNK